MDLSKILSITGKNGLYKFLSKTTNSFIVEGLDDGKRFPAFSSDGVAALDNIAIFTETDEIPLQTVFQNIYKKEDGKNKVHHQEFLVLVDMPKKLVWI